MFFARCSIILWVFQRLRSLLRYTKTIKFLSCVTMVIVFRFQSFAYFFKIASSFLITLLFMISWHLFFVGLVLSFIICIAFIRILYCASFFFLLCTLVSFNTFETKVFLIDIRWMIQSRQISHLIVYFCHLVLFCISLCDRLLSQTQLSTIWLRRRFINLSWISIKRKFIYIPVTSCCL